MSSDTVPDYSAVVSATGFLRPRASRSLETFHDHLITSNRILALLGAGLSASSGLPTFRGAGGLWRTHDARQLSTPAAFEADSALVWTFHLERIREIQKAEPNAAHHALKILADEKQDFLSISMNIDDLSEKACHPVGQLFHLHGSCYDVKCTRCEFRASIEKAEEVIAILNRRALANTLAKSDIPCCSRKECDGLLRPGLVWFTEDIPRSTLSFLSTWIECPEDDSKTIDLMLVVGTSALVYPGTAYVEAARRKGARIAVVDIVKEDPSLLGLEEQDWYFEGDAAEIVPRMLEPIVGELGKR